jgi:hypothetical protein
MMDVSPMFRPSERDSDIISRVLPLEATPEAITTFAELCDGLSDYAYWYVLGTLWVSYSGWSDLALWRRLLSSGRRCRRLALMKPSELAIFKMMPARIYAYRAHREGETDWISYTLDAEIAGRFAVQRDVNEVVEYRLRREDCIALFLRRGEKEVLMLDPARAERKRTIPIIHRPSQPPKESPHG